MKIIAACDSFKGSLSSSEAGHAITAGIHEEFPDAGVTAVPVADGGEGTVEALVDGLGGHYVECMAHDPLGRQVKARYGISGDGSTAIMEMSAASGLTLLRPEERNPLIASTGGTGDMMADALRHGCTTLLMGIGGSATNDGGMGMLHALGALFYDDNGRRLQPCGASLECVARVDMQGLMPELRHATLRVACDVDNPLCGARGASHVFGPQKGADPTMVARLDAGMASYARAVETATARSLTELPGTGAAGGLGFALAALGARLQPGIDIVLDAIDFDSIIDGADLVVTGEGRMDAQTLMGKTPHGILRRAATRGIPVIALTGSVNDCRALTDAGFMAVLPVVDGPCTLTQAMQPHTAFNNISRTAAMAARIFFHTRT